MDVPSETAMRSSVINLDHETSLKQICNWHEWSCKFHLVIRFLRK